MKTLVMITSQFPFGKGEPFLETELPIISSRFDRKIIIAQNAKLDQTRSIPAGFKLFRYNPATSVIGFLSIPVLVADNLSDVFSIIHGELNLTNRRNIPLTFRQSAFLIRKIIKALQLKRFISRILKRERISEDVVFYSYWLNSGAHAISLLGNRNSIKVARAHRHDLIEEDSKLSYLPMLSLCSRGLDAIFFISEKGMSYFIQKTGTSHAELILSRLGVPGGNISTGEGEDLFTIVSCSNILPFKRIDLIIKALAEIKTERKVRWIHFGDGPMRGDMERLSGELLSSMKNISYSFMGHIPNNELIEYYSTHRIDLFLNTSSIEGIPVSIMEAHSFGIPVIATDAGAIAEILTDDSGKMLSTGFEIGELVAAIEFFLTLPAAKFEKFRKGSLDNWKNRYDASVNYGNFAAQLEMMLANKIQQDNSTNNEI